MTSLAPPSKPLTKAHDHYKSNSAGTVGGRTLPRSSVNSRMSTRMPVTTRARENSSTLLLAYRRETWNELLFAVLDNLRRALALGDDDADWRRVWRCLRWMVSRTVERWRRTRRQWRQ